MTKQRANAKAERKNQFNPAEFDAPPATEERKLTRLEKWQEAMALQVERIADQAKRVTDARTALADAREKLTKEKATEAEMVAALNKMARDFGRGQDWLPFDETEPNQPLLPFEEPAITPPPAAVGPYSVHMLHQKSLRRLDPDEMIASAARNEPASITHPLLLGLEELGVKTVDDLEEALSCDAAAWAERCHVTPHQVKLLTNAIRIFRKHHPAAGATTNA